MCHCEWHSLIWLDSCHLARQSNANKRRALRQGYSEEPFSKSCCGGVESPSQIRISAELVLAPGIWGIRLCKPLPSNCRNCTCSFSDFANTSLNWDYENLCVSVMPWMLCLSGEEGWRDSAVPLTAWAGRAASCPSPSPFQQAACWTRVENVSVLKITWQKWGGRGRMNGLFLA